MACYGNSIVFLLCAVSFDSFYMPLLSVAMEKYKQPPGEKFLIQLIVLKLSVSIANDQGSPLCHSMA